MSVRERIRRLFARGTDHLQGGEYAGGLPPNSLPTGVDEGRPKK